MPPTSPTPLLSLWWWACQLEARLTCPRNSPATSTGSARPPKVDTNIHKNTSTVCSVASHLHNDSLFLDFLWVFLMKASCYVSACRTSCAYLFFSLCMCCSLQRGRVSQGSGQELQLLWLLQAWQWVCPENQAVRDTQTNTHIHTKYFIRITESTFPPSLFSRQCALAALRDVKSYLKDEGGQVAVSLRLI